MKFPLQKKKPSFHVPSKAGAESRNARFQRSALPSPLHKQIAGMEKASNYDTERCTVILHWVRVPDRR